MRFRYVAFAVAVAAFSVAAPSTVTSAGDGDKPIVLCWNKDYPAPVGTGTPQVRVTPNRCGFFKRGDSSGSAAVRARSLNWDWGNRRAVGRGVSVVNMGGSAPIEIRLSKPERNCSGDRVFTKASFDYPSFGSGGDFKLYTCAPARQAGDGR